jgi:hypothetical protein
MRHLLVIMKALEAERLLFNGFQDEDVYILIIREVVAGGDILVIPLRIIHFD